jgi:hypothetical protein
MYGLSGIQHLTGRGEVSSLGGRQALLDADTRAIDVVPARIPITRRCRPGSGLGCLRVRRRAETQDTGQDRVLRGNGPGLGGRFAALLEPPFDLLAKLPVEFRRRAVEYACFRDLARLKAPAFIKPADALNKSFDAGIYATARDIRAPKGVDPQIPVLLAEPVEWSAEYRCFIREGELAAWSPYLSFGRPVWKPFGQGTLPAQTPANLSSFCKRLFSQS